ncbi:MAG: ROK family protein [Arthrobacter sp.]|uniref:ROK family protein n=1 Tax=Arthrobacter sp. TaxID=1667 RepID=UPI00348F5C3A
MNPGFVNVFADRDGDVVVDNDANQASLAEHASGAGAGVRAYATLLSGERFGAVVVVDGRLLRGPRGAVGELRVLELVVGVDSPFGLAHQARVELARAADEGRLAGMLAACPSGEPEARHVFAAAEKDDPLALEIVDVPARRLAPVAMLLSGMLDLERIIIAGAIAPAISPVLKRTRELMGRDSTLSWAELVASENGDGVVLLGALHSAITLVRAGAFAD